MCDETVPVVNNDEIVACSFVFVKLNFHSVKMKLIVEHWADQSVKKAKICKTFCRIKGCKDTNLFTEERNLMK